MPGVCFAFEDNDADVYSGRQQDIDAWIYAMKIPGDIDRAVVVNTSEASLAGLDQSIDWQVVDEYPELEGKVTYLVTDTSSRSLWDFAHNTDWYVFGPASGWTETYQGIHIPQSNSSISLHSVHIATTVMFHRYAVMS